VLVDAICQALERNRVSIQHPSEVETLRQRYILLTPREREVMGFVGLPNK
jgi:FixJ family two-component response regulator